MVGKQKHYGRRGICFFPIETLQCYNVIHRRYTLCQVVSLQEIDRSGGLRSVSPSLLVYLSYLVSNSA